MRRHRASPPPLGAIGAGLPLQGRNGAKVATLLTLTLLAASAVIGYLQRAHPTPAPLVFFCFGWLVLLLWAAGRYGGPRWVAAAIVGMAICSTLTLTLASTDKGQRPAQLVPAKSSTGLASAYSGGWRVVRCLSGVRGSGLEGLGPCLSGKPAPEAAKPKPSAKGKPPTTTRRPR